MAFEQVTKSYETLADNLPTPGDGDTDVIPILERVWKDVDKDKNYQPTKNDHKIFRELFGKLALEERAAISLIDYMGLDLGSTAKILEKSIDEVKALLAKGRKILVESRF